MKQFTNFSEEMIQELDGLIVAPTILRPSKGDKPADYYLSEEYLASLKLVNAAHFSHLHNLLRHISAGEIPVICSFLKNENLKVVGTSSGLFYYPEDGFMSWHTNFKRNDWRVYFVKSEPGEKRSYFRYKENDQIITSMDPIGWSCRIFYVGDEKNLFWHCVYGGSGRYSVGFRLNSIEDEEPIEVPETAPQESGIDTQ